MNDYFCLKIEIKNEPSLKMPNLQGFPPTPLRKKVRSNRSATLNSLVGVVYEGSGGKTELSPKSEGSNTKIVFSTTI